MSKTDSTHLQALHDEQLVRRARQGDEAAFAELIGRHQHRLAGFVARSLVQGAQVDEIVQDSFVSAYEGLPRYSSAQASFSTWLHGIARNHIRRSLRERRRLTGKRHELAAFFMSHALANEQDDCSDVQEGMCEALRDCVGRLDGKQRQLLQRRYVDGESVKDIAGSVRRRPDSVSMVLLRLRKALQDCISRRLQEQPL